MFQIRRFIVVKLPGATALMLGMIGFCLTPYIVDAAGKFDGSVPFVCVPTAVAECVADGDCRPGTAQSENLPDFFRIDLKARTARAEEKGRVSPIKRIDRDADEVILCD